MQIIKVTATGIAHTGSAIVESINLVPGSASATAILNDSLDGSGDDKGGVKTEKEYSREQSLYKQIFETGIYVTLSGTGAVLYIYIS